MGEKPPSRTSTTGDSGQTSHQTRPARVCNGESGFACAFAGGQRCGIEDELARAASPQKRATLSRQIREAIETHPHTIERRCAETLHGGRIIVGVMGPGEGATTQDMERAEVLGRLIAEEGWVLLTGGRPAGVMAAANRGAKLAGGLTVGVLPSRTSTPENTARDVDIRIPTGLGDGRNIINVLASDVVIACGMGSGTASEVALALKSGKRVILLGAGEAARTFYTELGKEQVSVASDPHEALAQARATIAEQIKRANRRRGRPNDPKDPVAANQPGRGAPPKGV